jgi:hypothetical protein
VNRLNLDVSGACKILFRSLRKRFSINPRVGSFTGSNLEVSEVLTMSVRGRGVNKRLSGFELRNQLFPRP